jgi:hypothetical protein
MGVGSLGMVMAIRLEVETWVIHKGGTKRKGRKGWMGERRAMGASGFCGLSVCLGVFLLL